MLVRKFAADDMASALQQVKDTLGADALILSTRTLRKKGLGVLGKQTIEVTAAIESPAMRANSGKVVPSAAQKPAPRAIPAAYRNRVEIREDEPLSVPKPAPAAVRVELANHALEDEIRVLRSQLEGQNFNQLQAEIDQLKGLVQQLTQTAQPQAVATAPVVEAPVSSVDPVPTVEPVAPRRQAAVSKLPDSVPHELDDLIDLLIERGIDAEAAATIARFADQQMNERQRQEPQLRHEFLAGTIANLVQTSGPLWQPGDSQRRISLIGPTGVGKTTTIAKLAAEAMTNSGARVALVTIDTYRIAAVEQLKVYGEIMGLPVEVVLSPEQLQEAFRRHRDKDLILIDTAGRSPRDTERIDELNEFLGRESQVENCLVLAAPTAERLQQKSLEAFSILPISRLIFTKLDETDRFGALINLPTRNNLPLAYLTNGQQVPEDLLPAEPAMVAGLVMGGETESRRIAV
ncbi:MAG: flagellar biosynthesis protein FlhF [Desulfuromonadales bacterium]|nr:flagellar biosynthesis protein FlhF [Desulfuromonadales bacterium]